MFPSLPWIKIFFSDIMISNQELGGYGVKTVFQGRKRCKRFYLSRETDLHIGGKPLTHILNGFPNSNFLSCRLFKRYANDDKFDIALFRAVTSFVMIVNLRHPLIKAVGRMPQTMHLKNQGKKREQNHAYWNFRARALPGFENSGTFRDLRISSDLRF